MLRYAVLGLAHTLFLTGYGTPAHCQSTAVVTQSRSIDVGDRAERGVLTKQTTKADLVVIAVPVETELYGEKTENSLTIPPAFEKLVQIAKTKFYVYATIRGEFDGEHVEVLHFVLRQDYQGGWGGSPVFIDFDQSLKKIDIENKNDGSDSSTSEQRHTFLLFLNTNEPKTVHTLVSPLDPLSSVQVILN